MIEGCASGLALYRLRGSRPPGGALVSGRFGLSGVSGLSGWSGGGSGLVGLVHDPAEGQEAIHPNKPDNRKK